MRTFRTTDPDFSERWARLCARGSDEDEAEVREAAGKIIAEVRARGDQALLELTRRFDGWEPATVQDLCAGPAEFAAAYRGLAPDQRRALSLAARRIEAFHRRELDAVVKPYREASGATLGQVSRPLGRVGLYVPGGTARYPSSVLMTAIPAKVAGVREVLACSPADRRTGAVDAWTLAACHVSGVSRLFKMGGAQAVAALAYGTATVPAVDKICGPGNAYVAAAKRQVFGHVDIDMIAGPSEVLVIADASTDPTEAASDLIAQAEHDVRAVAVLVATREEVAQRTLAEVERQLADLPRREIAGKSLGERGAAVVARDIAEAVRLADQFAPEHLVVLASRAETLEKKITRAGAVFLGSSSPEAIGDYLAGPSHVLPTAGTARFASPLSVATFRRRMSVLSMTPRALAELAPAVEALAAAEGLEGHARAVRVRLARNASSVRPEGRGASRRRRAGACPPPRLRKVTGSPVRRRRKGRS